MKINKIESKAPTRIDLAGGTIDIWPIYLFLKNPLTINMAINLFAEATLDVMKCEDGDTPGITLRTLDQKTEVTISWKNLLSPPEIPKSLQLHFRLVHYFVVHHLMAQGGRLPDQHVCLTTKAQSPAGAGLGGSSTLSIALIGALRSWTSELLWQTEVPSPQENGDAFIEIVRDVETTVIEVPAGLQDYYAAMYGGLQLLNWKAGAHQRENFSDEVLEEVAKRTLLFYSGQSRNSGINNWELFKAFIDQQEATRERFTKIGLATRELQKALEEKNWRACAGAIQKEWNTRQLLGEGISTPEISRIFSENQTEAKGKICGAGGGGCFFLFLPDGDSKDSKLVRKKEEIVRRVTQKPGIQHLNFEPVSHGLEVTVRRD